MKRKSNQNTPQNDDDNDENSSKGQEKTKGGTHNTKNYKRKSSIKRHISNIHNENKVRKLKLGNDHLELKIKLHSVQIKVLQRLIIIQDHVLLRRNSHLRVKPNTIISNPNTITHEKVTDNGKY